MAYRSRSTASSSSRSERCGVRPAQRRHTVTPLSAPNRCARLRIAGDALIANRENSDALCCHCCECCHVRFAHLQRTGHAGRSASGRVEQGPDDHPGARRLRPRMASRSARPLPAQLSRGVAVNSAKSFEAPSPGRDKGPRLLCVFVSSARTSGAEALRRPIRPAPAVARPPHRRCRCPPRRAPRARCREASASRYRPAGPRRCAASASSRGCGGPGCRPSWRRG